MKKIIFNRLATICMAAILFTSCKKDYITGGVAEDVNKYKNTSTYEVLKLNPLYDTLVQVIDNAGIKDKINEAGTSFFAPSDYSILKYLASRTILVQVTINQNAKFALDSLLYYVKNNINGTKDSLLMYLVKKPLTYDVLTDMGTLYQTELAGNSAIVSYEYTRDENLGYNPVVSGVPQLVYFTHLWYPYNLGPGNPASDVPASIGVHTLVKSSGILTQNGVIHGLENSHNLFFYGTKK